MPKAWRLQLRARPRSLPRNPSPTPPAAGTAHSAVIAELGGGTGTILTLSDSKLNFLISFKTLAPNPKIESRGWGNSARWKSSGCYFWSG